MNKNRVRLSISLSSVLVLHNIQDKHYVVFFTVPSMPLVRPKQSSRQRPLVDTVACSEVVGPSSPFLHGGAGQKRPWRQSRARHHGTRRRHQQDASLGLRNWGSPTEQNMSNVIRKYSYSSLASERDFQPRDSLSTPPLPDHDLRRLAWEVWWGEGWGWCEGRGWKVLQNKFHRLSNSFS